MEPVNLRRLQDGMWACVVNGTPEWDGEVPVTLLLHGDNGEVGGLEMEWVRELHQLAYEQRSDGLVLTPDMLEAIATAISNILNPETDDE